MNRVLALQARLAKVPFGNIILSKMIARAAPYFTTIRPIIHELRPNYIRVSMRKRRAIHNHLKTVHAIASCNLCEFAGGLCIEVSLPEHKRWIPTGMDIKYLKLAKTDLTATCDLSHIDWETATDVPCVVSVLDTNGVEVVRAVINMRVTDKKQ